MLRETQLLAVVCFVKCVSKMDFNIQNVIFCDVKSFGIVYNLIHRDVTIAKFGPHNTWLNVNS